MNSKPSSHDHDWVREDWTRQWSMADLHVEPVGFHLAINDSIIAEVIQTLCDLERNALQGQTRGLKDATIGHVFHRRDGKITRFANQDAN